MRKRLRFLSRESSNRIVVFDRIRGARLFWSSELGRFCSLVGRFNADSGRFGSLVGRFNGSFRQLKSNAHLKIQRAVSYFLSWEWGGGSGCCAGSEVVLELRFGEIWQFGRQVQRAVLCRQLTTRIFGAHSAGSFEFGGAVLSWFWSSFLLRFGEIWQFGRQVQRAVLCRQLKFNAHFWSSQRREL